MHGAFSTEFDEEPNVYLEFFKHVKPNSICTDIEYQKKIYEKTIKLLKNYLTDERYSEKI